MKKSILYTIATIFLLIFFCGWYYIFFPPINIHSGEFWATFILWLSIVFLVYGAMDVLSAILGPKKIKKGKKRYGTTAAAVFDTIKVIGSGHAVIIVSGALIVVSLMFCIIGGIAGSPLFRAKAYASLITVEECDFATDIEMSDNITDIALMDTDSAQILGNRKIGSLSSIVSQYEVEDDYTQINLNDAPMKVASLKYASFFKYWNNKSTGIPGYVKVDPVQFTSSYVSLEKGMKYVPSAYFNDNLSRHVQMKYPTKIIYDYYFEVDEEGNPWYVCPTVTAKIGLFGGTDVVGAILCDPISGDCKYYKVEDVPSWVDRVYDGAILEQKYNWYGTYSDGFFNSVISQTGCVQTTDDYGYKTIGDDVWIYTGVTSVNGDESNIGFVMMNQRTSEVKYYSVSGAEEYSAMKAAEGEVQEKGYEASFPSLINVGGTPTYIMVLKDKGGLVKMYAMVNVEQYNIVVTSTTQAGVFTEYKKALAEDGNTDVELGSETKVIEVADIQYIVNDGNTTVYIKDTYGDVYKQAFADNEKLITVSVGDVLEITYEPVEGGINYLTEFSE